MNSLGTFFAKSMTLNKASLLSRVSSSSSLSLECKSVFTIKSSSCSKSSCFGSGWPPRSLAQRWAQFHLNGQSFVAKPMCLPSHRHTRHEPIRPFRRRICQTQVEYARHCWRTHYGISMRSEAGTSFCRTRTCSLSRASA